MIMGLFLFARQPKPWNYKGWIEQNHEETYNVIGSSTFSFYRKVDYMSSPEILSVDVQIKIPWGMGHDIFLQHYPNWQEINRATFMQYIDDHPDALDYLAVRLNGLTGEFTYKLSMVDESLNFGC
ncbi:MAG TPA: hypothetical protein V6C65_04155 [Allocoleopsis sp.]